MASKTASRRVFGIAELLEQILLYLGQDCSLETLFLLQRVNKLFKDSINRSVFLRRRMRLLYDDAAGQVRVYPNTAALYPKLDPSNNRKLDISPLELISTGPALFGHGIIITFSYNAKHDFGMHWGVRGRNNFLHRYKKASWRRMKITCVPMPIYIVVRMAYEGHTVELSPSEATLGKMVDVLEEARRKDQARKVAETEAAKRRWLGSSISSLGSH